MNPEETTQPIESTDGATAVRSYNKKKIVLIASSIVLVVLAGIAAGLVWLYRGPVTETKVKVFSKLPLPAAVVDTQLLSAHELLNQYELAKKLTEGNNSVSEGQVKEQVYEQLINTKKLGILASQNNLSASDTELDQEYRNLVNQITQGDEAKFTNELLAAYGMDVTTFKNKIIRSEVEQARLVTWYNEQRDLNKDSYATVDEVQSKLNNGEAFDALAKQYSQDESTKDFGGDAGFVILDELLPEFRAKLAPAKPNDIIILPSRYGIHIVKMLEQDTEAETNKTRVHVQQIFLASTGYDTWYKQATDSIKVRKLLQFN